MSATPAGGSRRSGVGAWVPWLAMVLVAVVTLGVGTFDQGTPTDAERARNLADTINCPSCDGQSAASSDTPASQAIRDLIRERVEAGSSDEEIRDYVVTRFPGTALDPSGSGFSGLVWAVPVVVVIAALAGLVYRFRDWRPGEVAVTQADRDLVADALRSPAAEDANADAERDEVPTS